MNKNEAIVEVGNNLSQSRRRKSSSLTLLQKTWKRVIWNSENPKELQSMEWDSRICSKCQVQLKRKSSSMGITCPSITMIRRLIIITIHNRSNVLWNSTLRILPPIGQLMLYINLRFAAFRTHSHSGKLWASTAEMVTYPQIWKITKDKSSNDLLSALIEIIFKKTSICIQLSSRAWRKSIKIHAVTNSPSPNRSASRPTTPKSPNWN